MNKIKSILLSIPFFYYVIFYFILVVNLAAFFAFSSQKVEINYSQEFISQIKTELIENPDITLQSGVIKGEEKLFIGKNLIFSILKSNKNKNGNYINLDQNEAEINFNNVTRRVKYNSNDDIKSLVNELFSSYFQIIFFQMFSQVIFFLLMITFSQMLVLQVLLRKKIRLSTIFMKIFECLILSTLMLIFIYNIKVEIEWKFILFLLIFCILYLIRVLKFISRSMEGYLYGEEVEF